MLKLNPTLLDNSISSSIIFAIGGLKGRVEAALAQVGAGDGFNDRLFAAEEGLEECGSCGSALAAVERHGCEASSGVQVWRLGDGGGLLCEVSPCAGQGGIQCWDAFLGNRQLDGGRGGGSGVFCWLMCADSSGAVVYLDLLPAVAAVASAATAAALPPIPQLIRSLDLAAKLQAAPGHASITHSVSRTQPAAQVTLLNVTDARRSLASRTAAARQTLKAVARRVR